MKLPKILLLAALALSLTALAGCQTNDPDATIHIFSTTDIHGYLLAQPNKTNILVGGLDYMAGYMSIAKKQDPETLLLDSGDLFQGTLVSNDYEGSTVIKFYNYVNYDATAIGNHDFDFGPEGPDTVARNPSEDPLGALKAREKQANFKFLSANICAVNEDPKQCQDQNNYQSASFTTPYVIKTVHGIKVGIIGVTTADTPTVTMPQNVAALRFLPIDVAIEHYAPAIKDAGARFIIVIAHAGGFCKDGVCDKTDEIFSAIDKLSDTTRKYIPIILAGHTHNYTNTTYNGVRVVMTGAYGQSFGYTTLDYKGSDGSVSVNNVSSVDYCQEVYPDTKQCYKGTGTPVPATFLGETVVPDAAAPNLIASEIAAADAEGAKVVGHIDTALKKTSPESQVGDLMADGMRLCYADSSCSQAADVAIQNNGGIRADIPTAGDVSFNDVFAVMPFDNFIATAKMSGRELHDLLDEFYAERGEMQQVSGLTIEYNVKATTQRTLQNDSGATESVVDPIMKLTTSDGQPVEDVRMYTVVMADFLATGGGGDAFIMNALNPQATINYDRKVRDTIVDLLESRPQGLSYARQAKRLIKHSIAE